MSNRDERNLTVIESVKTEIKTETVKKMSRQTNPIMKKLVEFQHENAGKFGVRDLFKK